MSCSFLVRLDNESTYSYIVYEGCKDGTQSNAALHYWIKRLTELRGEDRPLNINTVIDDALSVGLPLVVWTRFQHMVSVVDQKFEVVVTLDEKTNVKHLIAEPREGKMSPLPYFATGET